MEPITFSVEEENVGQRIDIFLTNILGVSRNAVQRLFKESAVTLNGEHVAKNYILRLNDAVFVACLEDGKKIAVPQNIPLDIVYEDEHLLVIDKPKGMVVHPAAGHWENTLVNALLYHYPENLSTIGGDDRPGIVHRIDKDTSGLLLAAKTNEAHVKLAEQMQKHEVTRKYQAVVYGNIKEEKGTVCLPIGRHPVDRKKMSTISNHGKEACTHYDVIARYTGFTHLMAKLETGRTHQIRVHMAAIGHPVAGDPVYGPKKVIAGLNGQCLHAYCLEFKHPMTGLQMSFSSPLPEYFIKFLSKINR